MTNGKEPLKVYVLVKGSLMRVWEDTTHKYIVRVHIDARQWAKYDALVNEIVSLVNAQTHPVSLLITRSGEGHFNGAYEHIRRALVACVDLPMLDKIVNVLPDPQCFTAVIIRTILHVDLSQHEHRWHLVASLDAGYRLLREHNTSPV